jgi:hypothetical protein
MLAQKQYHAPVQDIYQVPPSMGPAPVQDIYQVPPSARGPVPGQDIYQVPPSLNQTQIPPSIEKRSWDSKPLGKVRKTF